MSGFQNKGLRHYSYLLQPGSACQAGEMREDRMQLDSRGRPDPCQVLQVITTTKSIWMLGQSQCWFNHLCGAKCRNYFVNIGQWCYVGSWSSKMFLFLCKRVISGLKKTSFMASCIGCLCGMPVCGMGVCVSVVFGQKIRVLRGQQHEGRVWVGFSSC